MAASDATTGPVRPRGEKIIRRDASWVRTATSLPQAELYLRHPARSTQGKGGGLGGLVKALSKRGISVVPGSEEEGEQVEVHRNAVPHCRQAGQAGQGPEDALLADGQGQGGDGH